MNRNGWQPERQEASNAFKNLSQYGVLWKIDVEYEWSVVYRPKPEPEAGVVF